MKSISDLIYQAGTNFLNDIHPFWQISASLPELQKLIWTLLAHWGSQPERRDAGAVWEGPVNNSFNSMRGHCNRLRFFPRLLPKKKKEGKGNLLRTVFLYRPRAYFLSWRLPCMQGGREYGTKLPALGQQTFMQWRHYTGYNNGKVKWKSFNLNKSLIYIMSHRQDQIICLSGLCWSKASELALPI